MAFKRTQNPTFSTKVTVNIPNDKGGFDKSTFEGFFKRLSTDQLKALREENLSDEDVVRQVLVDWKMTDEDTKEEVPFSKLELEAALQIQPMPSATAYAFWMGSQGARVKN